MNGEPPLFNLRPPEGQPVPLLVSIPHTGTYVPEHIGKTFAGDHIRALPMTDWHLHHLYDFLPTLGVTTLYANYSRFVVDLNRPPDSKPLYAGRFETGLIATRTFQGEQIFTTPPDDQTVAQRRSRFHAPYHQKLAELLEGQRAEFGRAFLIDAHSVASRANLLHSALMDDIYLGDRDGETCAPWMIDLVSGGFSRAGFKVVRNQPYKGGYITSHYGRMPRTQALQIEMCQRTYMDESDPAIALGLPQFTDMKRVLHEVFSGLVAAITKHDA